MAHRTFIDRIGMTWEVWDVRPSTAVLNGGREALTGVMAEGWLCFQSGSTRKRLHPIPENWEQLGDEELVRYHRMASPVPSRNSPAADATADPDLPRVSVRQQASVPGQSA